MNQWLCIVTSLFISGPLLAQDFGGEEVTSTGGYKVRLSRPLDFLVVADHSDNMGLFTMIFDSAPSIMMTRSSGHK